MSLIFLQQICVEKIQKIDKNSSSQRSKNSYLLRDLLDFNEILGKNATYDDIKSDKIGLQSSDSMLFEIYSQG